MSKVHYQATINAPWEKDQPLFQQVGLVTGASQGVGKGIATALFKAGCRVYITGRNIVTLEKSAKDIMSTSSRSKGEVIPMECDAADDEATKNLFQKIFQDNNNHLNILVNNVTMNLSHTGKRNSHGAADDANDINMNLWWNRDTLEEWDVTNRVGLRSYFASSSTAAKAMIQQRRGLIVNISSFGGVRKYIGIPHGVVKTATDRMSSDMADDLAEYGVAIVSMYPGLVRTEKMLATKAGPRILKSKASETPEYTGRAIVALYLAVSKKCMYSIIYVYIYLNISVIHHTYTNTCIFL